jgi:serine protease inhibitor
MSLARIILGSLLLATCVIPAAHPAVSAEGSPVELKASAANYFGAKIFDRLAGGAASQNVVFSPFSLDAALDMLTLAADGETAKRLNASLPTGRAVKTMAELQKSLASAQSEGVTFRSANALWLKDKAAARSSYVAAMQGVFHATVENANFSDPETVTKVNGWVKQNTQNLIPQIVDRLDPRPRAARRKAATCAARSAPPTCSRPLRTRPGRNARSISHCRGFAPSSAPT